MSLPLKASILIELYRQVEHRPGWEGMWNNESFGILVAEIERLRAELATAREDALREAAKVCEARNGGGIRGSEARYCARAILALIPPKPPAPSLYFWLGLGAENV